MRANSVPLFSIFKYCSVREGLPRVMAILWVQLRLPHLHKGTPTEHSHQKNWEVAWDMTLPLSSCTQSWSCATVLLIQILWGESWSPRNSITRVSIGTTPTSAQIPGPRGTHPEPSGHRNQGTAGDRILLQLGASWLCANAFHTKITPGDLVSQEYWHTHRFAGETCLSQRQNS